MASPGTAFALVLNGLVVAAAAVAVGYLWLHRERSGGDPVQDWYAEATELAREIQRLGEVEEAVANHDRIQREILPLSGRLQGHARAAPAGVDARHVTELYRLGDTCSKIGLEHTAGEAARTGEFLETKLEALGAEAEAFEAAVASGSKRDGETSDA